MCAALNMPWHPHWCLTKNPGHPTPVDLSCHACCAVLARLAKNQHQSYSKRPCKKNSFTAPTLPEPPCIEHHRRGLVRKHTAPKKGRDRPETCAQHVVSLFVLRSQEQLHKQQQHSLLLADSAAGSHQKKGTCLVIEWRPKLPHLKTTARLSRAIAVRSAHAVL